MSRGILPSVTVDEPHSNGRLSQIYRYMAILTQILLLVLAVTIAWKYWGATALHMPIMVTLRKKAVTVMHPKPSYVKVAVFVPVAYSDIVRDALARAGAGVRPGFVSESFSVRGLGRWQKAPIVTAAAQDPHDAHGHGDTHGGHHDHHADNLDSHSHGGHDSHHDDHTGHSDNHTDSHHAPEPVLSEAIYAEEDRIEVIAAKSALDNILLALKNLHIDSHMAIDIYHVDPA